MLKTTSTRLRSSTGPCSACARTRPRSWPGRTGLIRSRALGGGGVRLALNVPLVAGPSELQHIAFACDDALAAAHRCADAGVPLLAISDNYYDDLAARTALPGERIAELRAAGVLYDADEHGELLHFFTALVGDRLFFEVLERRRGYDGYGAANSAVRLGAQGAHGVVADRV